MLYIVNTEESIQSKHNSFDLVLADLGYNLLQVGDPAYGMSFSLDCELDMRYDTSRGIPCKDILAFISAYELDEILHSTSNNSKHF